MVHLKRGSVAFRLALNGSNHVLGQNFAHADATIIAIVAQPTGCTNTVPIEIFVGGVSRLRRMLASPIDDH